MAELLDRHGRRTRPPGRRTRPFARLKADFDKKPAGSDPAARAQVALANLPPKPAQPDNAVAEIVGKFLAQYPGPVPGDEDKATDAQGLLVYQIWKLHAAHVWDNAAGVSAWAQTLGAADAAGRQLAADGPARPRAVGMADPAEDDPGLRRPRPRRPAHDDPQVWAQFMGLNGPSGITASPFTDAYDLMTDRPGGRVAPGHARGVGHPPPVPRRRVGKGPGGARREAHGRGPGRPARRAPVRLARRDRLQAAPGRHQGGVGDVPRLGAEDRAPGTRTWRRKSTASGCAAVKSTRRTRPTSSPPGSN